MPQNLGEEAWLTQENLGIAAEVHIEERAG